MEKPQLKYFTVLGERCSGTHFVRYAIEWNFNLEYYPTCDKHFFGHDDSVFDTEKMKETLVVCLFRKPVDWLDSYFKRHHQIPAHNWKNAFNYLNNEFYAIYEVPPNLGKDMEFDYHITEKRRYHNIIELRKVKYDFLLNNIPKLVDNYMMLRYEDLRDNYEGTLENIMRTYDLIPKLDIRLRSPTSTVCLDNVGRTSSVAETNFKKIVRYKGTYTLEYFKKPILLKPHYQEHILRNIDQEQEDRIEKMDFKGICDSP
jgi:hypothetical protein